MGVEIVKAAMVYGNQLSGNAYKVLVTMSMSALDKPKDGRPASLYFGGWGALATSLGYPAETSNDRNSAGHKAVKRAVRELRTGSHISPMVEACRGTRQSYFVHPGGFGKGDQNDPVKGDHFDPNKGDQNSPQRGTKMVPPRKDTGSRDDLSQDITLPSATELQTAREDESSNEMSPHKFRGQPAADCEACGRAYLNRQAHPLHLLRGA